MQQALLLCYKYIIFNTCNKFASSAGHHNLRRIAGALTDYARFRCFVVDLLTNLALHQDNTFADTIVEASFVNNTFIALVYYRQYNTSVLHSVLFTLAAIIRHGGRFRAAF